MTFHDLKLRLRSLLSPRRAERDLDEELAFHIERETQKQVASGVDLTEARRRALVRFGSVALAADECRDERRTGFVDTSVRDLRYALRALRRAPLSAVTIACTVALGLGLLTAAFTFFDTYFLREDAVRDPHELFSVKRTFRPGAGGTWLAFTRREYDALRRDAGAFDDAMGWVQGRTTRVDGVMMQGMLVTGNFFQVLGVGAVLGRTLTSVDDIGEGRRVLVMSHRGWRRLFAADPSAVGRTVRVNGVPYDIVGVMPEAFRGLQGGTPDYWAPLALGGELRPEWPRVDEPTIFLVVGRLKRGLSLPAARNALGAWAARADLRPYASRPDQRLHITVEPNPGPTPAQMFRGQIGALFVTTALAFGLVLVIGCANVANILLARGVERQREIGVRMALGASRGRIIRQLLTESLLLAAIAAVGGFVISRVALSGALAVAGAGAPAGILEWLIGDPPPADWRVALFLAGGAIVATASFGLLPALHGTRLALVVRTLRGEVAREAGPGQGRHMLIAVQVCASALLLIGAAVFLRGAWAASKVDHGIRTTDTLLVPVTDERVRNVILAEVTAHSSVAEVAAAVPRLGVQSSLITVQPLPDAGQPRGPSTVGSYQLVQHSYFDVLGIRAVQGRTFNESERTADAGVVVISEWLARRAFRGDAVGRALTIPSTGDDGPGGRVLSASDRVYTVIGVVREPEWNRSFAGVFIPMGPDGPAAELAVRVRGNPEQVRIALLERLLRVDPALGQIVTLESIFGEREHLLRTGFRGAVAVGALALVLTVSGLFGVLSYLVARRTPEIGVRIALGATTQQVARLVLSQSMRAVAIGLVAGAALAGGVAKALMSTGASAGISELIDVYDPLAYVVSLLVVVAACALAAWLPALRAARIDPGTVLKQE